MRRSMLIPAVMAIVFAGAVVPAMTQVQLPGATDVTQTLTGTTQDLLAAGQELLNGVSGPIVTGILVDSSCYTMKGKVAMGEGGHEKCALVCAQKGHRLAVVTEKGDVYMVIGLLAQDNNARLIPFINKTVVIAGQTREVIIQDVTDTAPVPVKTDKRRPTGNEEGVTPPMKKGDSRQGDKYDAPEMVIDALSIELAKVRLVP